MRYKNLGRSGLLVSELCPNGMLVGEEGFRGKISDAGNFEVSALAGAAERKESASWT